MSQVLMSKLMYKQVLKPEELVKPRQVLELKEVPGPREAFTYKEVSMSNIPPLTKTAGQKTDSRSRGAALSGKTISEAQDYIRQAGRWLVDVPVSILAEHSAWIPTGNWHGMFDCAVWLRTPAGLTHPVQLALKYIDNSGEKIIQIDRCQPGGHSTVLLNGSIALTINARVRDMGLYLIGATDAAIALEEWHLAPQQRR